MTVRRLFALAALAGVVVLVGCSAAPTLGGDLGQEGGYNATDSIRVTAGDGLNESEREAVVSRAMARIEVIREEEFTNTTGVEVISRAEFRNRTGGGDATNLTDRQLWNEQVWEALFIIGEDATYPGTRTSNRGASVVGYYADGRIVLVSDSPTPTVDRRTLVHELVHALQDQQFNFGTNPQFQDRQLAERGVTEGEANYISALYRQRCGSEWDCIPRPNGTSRTRPDGFNQALFLTTFAPYAEGPRFVDAIRQRGGWELVNDLYETFPESTEQVIHPGRYPNDDPVEVTVPDRSTDRWARFTEIGRPVYDVAGEASIYAMFQGNGLVGRTDTAQYDYDHRFSAGWAGDALVPYRAGDAYGYVWRLRWDTTRDAREFLGAYRDLLDSRGATSLDGDRYRIPDGDPFGDAFRVTRSGRTVTVVNAPTVEALDAVHRPS